MDCLKGVTMKDGFDRLVDKIMREDKAPYSVAHKTAVKESGTDPLDKMAWKIARAEKIPYSQALKQAYQENPTLQGYLK